MDDIFKVAGRIHSIETCGTVDGPGIRYVVFAQGCPLRCLYCHNPDTWNIKSKDAPTMTVGEIMTDVRKYKSYFKASGGGLTLTGGEPLMQKKFAIALFEACRQEGIHTALDTSGYTGIDDLTKEVLNRTDLVLLDMKSVDAEMYKRLTGSPIERNLDFARHLRDEKIRTWVSFVLVPGITDSEEHLHALAKCFKNLGNVEKVGVLPFHQLGAFKWKRLGLNYELGDTPEPTVEETEQAKELFKSYGFVIR